VRVPWSKPRLEITSEHLNSPGLLSLTQEANGKDQKEAKSKAQKCECADVLALMNSDKQFGALLDKMFRETSFSPEEKQILADKYKISFQKGDYPEETDAEYAQRLYNVEAPYEQLLERAKDTTNLKDAIKLLKELESDDEGFAYENKTIREKDWKEIQNLIQKYLDTKTTRDWYTCIDFVSGL